MATKGVRGDWLERARSIALRLPEATEKVTWGHPTFRVRDKIFLGIGASGDTVDFHPEGREGLTTMSMKAAPGEQETLLASGHPFFRPKYVGNRGWIGVIVDNGTDWSEVEELIVESYRAIAPSRLAALLDK